MKNKELNDLFDDKFMTASKFSMEVEEIVRSNHGGLTYIDAILVYCEENQIELENERLMSGKETKVLVKKQIGRAHV